MSSLLPIIIKALSSPFFPQLLASLFTPNKIKSLKFSSKISASDSSGMVSSGGGEDLRGKRKKVVAELVKGKGIAVQLKTLIESRDWELGRGNDVVLAKDLSVQMVRSFNRILSAVNSGGNPPAADGGDRGKKKPADVKRRRGCYNRKNSESRVIESPTAQDGLAWRKYGQKTVLNSQHPRCYYRCRHKSDGCKARKQVQIIKDDPITYLVTYLNHHTCSTNNTVSASYGNPIADSSTIISFQTKTCQQNETSSSNNNANRNSTNPEIETPLIVKVKEDGADDDDDDQSNEGANFSDGTKSTALMGFGLDHKPEWGHDPMTMFELGFDHHQSCETTSLLQYGYDDVDEVNQIGDIDMIYFGQELI